MNDLKLNHSLQKGSSRPVRVSIPANAAFDRDKMLKITDRILNELGCPNCHSGFDIRFDIERRFIFDRNLELVGPQFR